MADYVKWGFTENPFSIKSLPPSTTGMELLVGRNGELATLVSRIASPPRIPTLEGMNGVGKTSLVNVAGYICFCDFIDDPDKPLYIPCGTVFQLTPTSNVSEFVMKVLMEVAQTLIDYSSKVEGPRLHSLVEAGRLREWLNAPQVSGYQISAGAFGGGSMPETNTGEGYASSGFPRAVRNILSQVFPDESTGAVVCVIDNLELLQTSDAARQLLESLRDELFVLPGLRWVLCGALGIVRGVTSSPRLDGMMFDPLDVPKVPDEAVVDILDSRKDAYGAIEDPYLPFSPSDFMNLYSVLRGNMRALLGHIDEFCQHVSEAGVKPDTIEEKQSVFQGWLDDKARKLHEAAHVAIGFRAQQVFSRAAELGGLFAPSDYAEFGFNKMQAFRPHVKDLEDVGLVVSTQDEGDRRRKTIQITPKGWLVAYHHNMQRR